MSTYFKVEIVFVPNDCDKCKLIYNGLCEDSIKFLLDV